MTNDTRPIDPTCECMVSEPQKFTLENLNTNSTEWLTFYSAGL